MREGIITSEKINSLSPQAELFYRRLMSVADDYGRYFAHTSIIRAACYPLQLSKVSEQMVYDSLCECVMAGLIIVYNNGKHIQIVNFGQQTRAKSKYPQPTDNELLIKCISNAKQMLSLVGVGVGVVSVVGDVVVVGVGDGEKKQTTTTTLSELPSNPTYEQMAQYLKTGHRGYSRLSEHQIISAFAAHRGTLAKTKMAEAVRELIRHYAGDADLEMPPIKRLETYLRGATMNKRRTTGQQNTAPGIDARLLDIRE